MEKWCFLPDSILVNSRCMLSVTTRRPRFSLTIRYLKRRQTCGCPSAIAALDASDYKNIHVVKEIPLALKLYTP